MGGGLEVDLSHGAVAAMWRSPGSTLRPVMQVVDARHVPDGSGLSPAREQRYRVDLSDGVHSQPGTLSASQNRLVRDGALRRGSVVRVLDFVCDYRRRTITVLQLQILQTECSLIGSLKPYEPTRKSAEFTTRSLRYALRPDREPSFRGQHIHQSCIASEAEISANSLPYHGACVGSSLPGGDSPCSVDLFAKPAVWKVVRQIKDEYLGYLDGPDFITVKAFISFVNTERICSAACPLAVNGKLCNVKATGNGGGTWHCKLCRQSYESCDYGIRYCKRCGHNFDSCDYGYSVHIQIQDHTGTTFATVYEEAAKEIFGCTAKDLYLMEYKERYCNQLGAIKQFVVYKQYVLQLKVEVKPFSDGRPEECVVLVLKAEKVNPLAESHRLLGAIDTHLCEGLDSCWEFGNFMPSYSDLSDFKGRSTARSSNSGDAVSTGFAKWMCSADRYGQQVNEYDVKPSALSTFGARGCRVHGLDMDGQRSSAPDGFMGSWFYGASPSAANFAPDVHCTHSTRTSADRAERSPQRSSAPDGWFYGASPSAANFAPDVHCTHSTRTSAHRAEGSPKKP